MTYESITVPSTFPPANRPVIIRPVADMVFKLKEEEWPKLAKGVINVCNQHPDERILIHSVSYQLTEYLKAYLERNGRACIVYANAAERTDALSRFAKSINSVILAPSLDRGIDLVGDACRVQVIAKCPFLNLKDRQIAARRYSKNGELWYAVNTIRTIIQMCGRVVRSEDDYGVTYILDRQFSSNLWPRYKRLFPSWWKDGLVWET